MPIFDASHCEAPLSDRPQAAKASDNGALAKDARLALLDAAHVLGVAASARQQEPAELIEEFGIQAGAAPRVPAP
jgi:hypothetical protein